MNHQIPFILFNTAMPETFNDAVVSPTMEVLKANYISIEQPEEFTSVQLSEKSSKAPNSDFQTAFSELLQFKPISQEPTDQDIKPKQRYHFLG